MSTKGTTTLYFAYGSNLCTMSMSHRCPAAVPVGPATLKGWRLVFRGVADVEPHQGSEVTGALWDCTDKCVASLDIYEGVAGGFYSKETLTVVDEHGTEREALVYVMIPTRLDNMSLPSRGYLETIARGYRDFSLDDSFLSAALDLAYRRVVEKKGVTEFVPHGPKRMGPAGTVRPRRSAPKGKPMPRAKKQKKKVEWTGQKSPATVALEQAEFRERERQRNDEYRRARRQKQANAAALATLSGRQRREAGVSA